MSQVGIRALKQNASAVVARVVGGETVTITDRGRPVARMTPIRASGLRHVVETGQARPARRTFTEVPPPEPGPSLSVVLQQMRDEQRW